MMILTKAIKEKLIANHKAQDGTKSFKAVLKLFNPTSCQLCLAIQGKVAMSAIEYSFPAKKSVFDRCSSKSL